MSFQSDGLMRIVYFSRNRIALPAERMAEEIDTILQVSRANNARHGVTGALMHNAGVFGQVLEGPAEAIEETFERIQLDDRHAEVTLLEIAPIGERGFSDWTMGFVGQTDLRAAPGFDLARLSGQEVFEVLHDLMLRNERRPSAA